MKHSPAAALGTLERNPIKDDIGKGFAFFDTPLNKLFHGLRKRW